MPAAAPLPEADTGTAVLPAEPIALQRYNNGVRLLCTGSATLTVYMLVHAVRRSLYMCTGGLLGERRNKVYARSAPRGAASQLPWP